MRIELITRAPASASDRGHLLFIHGGFHGAWCWDEHFLPWFAARGFTAHALSLRGHAGSEGHDAIASFTLDDYVDDVLGVLATLGGDAVLIGHSLGGVVAQMCWQRSVEVSGLVLMASSPLKISPRVALRMLVKHPVDLVLGQLRKDPIRMRAAMAPFFFSPELPLEKHREYSAKLSSESLLAVSQIFSREPPPQVASQARPVLVLAGADDWSIPMHEHEDVCRRYRGTLTICPGSHDLMLDPAWEDSARAIESWLAQRPVAPRAD